MLPGSQLLNYRSPLILLQVPVSVPSSPGSENYTIIYSDANDNVICGSKKISANSCIHGVCNDIFEVSNSSCSPDSDITVTAIATNMFGGSPDKTLFVGMTITFCILNKPVL